MPYNGMASGMTGPVLRRGRIFWPDVQGRPPVGWCQVCGAEIFDEEQPLCLRCGRRKWYEWNDKKSVPDLQTGGGSGEL